MASPALPFHEALVQARMRSYTLQSTLAAAAGVTVALVAAVELGHVQPTRAIYDAAIAMFPALRRHPRPGPDPNARLVARVPQVVEMEYRRVDAFHRKVLGIRVGAVHMTKIGELLRMALNGECTHADIDRYFF